MATARRRGSRQRRQGRVRVDVLTPIRRGESDIQPGTITSRGRSTSDRARRIRAIGNFRRRIFQQAADELGSYCLSIAGQRKYILAWWFERKYGDPREWVREAQSVRVESYQFVWERR